MGFIGEEDVRKVREATDLVALIGERVPVKQKGREFWCCCPLHHEKTPSFKIDPTTQLWHCFGCHEGGDVFGFLMKTEDMSFPEAVRVLAERAHIEIAEDSGERGASQGRKARLKDCCRETASFYHTCLMRSKDKNAQAARSYLAARSLGGEVPGKWNLGFAPGNGALVRHLAAQGFKSDEMIEANVAVRGRDGRPRDRFFNRIMFPICDVAGECIAFGGRVVGTGEPKYLNSQETPIFHKSQVLFWLDHAKASMASTGVAVVVEGYTDVITLHQAGLQNVVATLGTALTKQHIRMLSRHARKRIVYLFDGDSAGQRAADRALSFIDGDMTPEAGRTKVELCAVTLPDDLDPADFVAQRGADALRALLEDAQPLLSYGIERRLARYDLSRPEGRSAAFAEALAVLAPIKDSLLAKDYAVRIAGRVHVREQDALDALAQLKVPRTYTQDGDSGRMREVNRETTGAGTGADSYARGVQNTQNKQNAQGTQSTGHTADARYPGNEPMRMPVSVSSQERNRRQHERKFLCLCAQDPALALKHADVLSALAWHEPASRALGERILEALAAKGTYAPGELVTLLIADFPSAASMLTRSPAGKGVSPEELAAYLAEELSLGDLEDAIAELNAQSKDPALSGEESAQFFEMAIAMQKDLARRRANNEPPSQHTAIY